MGWQEEFARRVVHGAFRRIRGGEITVVEDGVGEQTFGQQDEHRPLRATLYVRSRAFYTALLRGSAGLGQSYMDRLWDADCLTDLIRIGARSMAALDAIRWKLHPVLGPIQRLKWRLCANTRARSRKHIAAHYDLGNHLFENFLDETLAYSCGIFERDDSTLYEASVEKMDRACRKLALTTDDHLLEIGTGWGGMAIHAAQNYGCRVTTTTISREQYEYAQARIERAGLSDQITLLLEDYRDLRGQYDKLVSIEMIEAVGWEYLDTFFECCSKLLKPDGAMLLQAITKDERLYELEKASVGFIGTYIFPGGNLVSVKSVAESIAKRTNFRMVDLEDITAHYATTLRCWRENFLTATERLKQLGYNQPFRRMWELYLSYCEAGFREQRIGDIQLLLAKPFAAIGDRQLARVGSAAS